MIEYTDEALKAVINEIAATDNGKIFFAALKEHCKWEHTYTSTENPQATQYYAALRGVYGGIRSHIKPEYLIPIEFNYKKKVTDDRGKLKSTKSTKSTNKSGK